MLFRLRISLTTKEYYNLYNVHSLKTTFCPLTPFPNLIATFLINILDPTMLLQSLLDINQSIISINVCLRSKCNIKTDEYLKTTNKINIPLRDMGKDQQGR